ncbi:MAG: hypothetical protein ACLQAH_09015 [Limisphaerales bacterium]
MKMDKLFKAMKLQTIVTILLLAVGRTQAQVSIAVDNFDGAISDYDQSVSYPGLYELYSGDSVGNWTVTGPGYTSLDNPGSSVEVITPTGDWQSPDGHNTLDMDGRSVGQIQTTLYVPFSGTVTVDFWLAANPSPDYSAIKTLQVALGANSQVFTFDRTGHSYSSMGWTLESATFANVSAGDLVLALTSLDAGGLGTPTSGGGAAVGTVTAFVTAVPEPPTWLSGVFGVGIVLVGWFRRSRSHSLIS